MTTGRPRLLILGTGFGAFNLVSHLKDDYEVTVVSPRNHFLFTPLLPSTTVGTIEFRSIIEPIRHARRDIRFFHGYAVDLDRDRRSVRCRGASEDDPFTVEYEILVIAVGAVTNTFGISGVEDHALFLKELNDAREIRLRIIRSFERANLPVIGVEERRKLLHFVICGGGPTGVEFAAELNDFFLEDLRKTHPHLIQEARITLVEAGTVILSSFDEKLRRYATDLFRRHQIEVLTNSPVVRVDKDQVYLADGRAIPYGLLLWSTGNGPTHFVEHADLPRNRRGLLLIDPYFRVKGCREIYAIGDCSILESTPIPATAQAAQQQGKYLARSLTRLARNQSLDPFRYHHLGMLAYVGGNRALADLETFKGRGWATWLFWRSAYISRIVSLKNKTLVLFDWIKAQVFGRDTSQF